MMGRALFEAGISTHPPMDHHIRVQQSADDCTISATHAITLCLYLVRCLTAITFLLLLGNYDVICEVIQGKFMASLEPS